MPDDPILRVQNVHHSYRKGVPVLQGIDLTLQRGEIVALIGRSGAGKSTLLRIVNGLITPTSGDVGVFGIDIAKLPESQRRLVRRRIGMVFQEFNLVDRLTAVKNVLVGRLGYTDTLRSCLHLFSAADIALATECLARVGLAGFEHTRVRDLSGGQKQRVAIARTLAQGSEIILGDEATANLDEHTTTEVLSILSDLARERGITLLLSMHDLTTAREFCQRIVAMKGGKIVFNGAPDQLSDEIVREVLA
ncbi:MAG TPA: phosphonate ABC transporter ATP-binding protein [Capsulimonadaceae bacterium]|jgi:phosphonate transport system ATP-binding protein